VYKVRTGRTGLVEKRVSLVPETDCERNSFFKPSAYRNTLVLIVTQCTEAAGGEVEPGTSSTHFSRNAVRWSVDCNFRCYRLFSTLSRSLFEGFINL